VTKSEELVSRVRMLAHDDRNERFEATPFQSAALELCEEYELAMKALLRLENTIHEMRK